MLFRIRLLYEWQKTQNIAVKHVHLFPTSAVLNCPRLSDYKQQKCVLSRFWRPEVQNQGVGSLVLPLEALTEIPSISLATSGGFQHSL